MDHRLSAIDAKEKKHLFLTLPNMMKPGNQLPGVFRCEEYEPRRLTSRAELACIMSWKRLLLKAEKINSPSGWYLLMEDDLGASLARPKEWVHSLLDLIEYCPKNTLAIQCAPISAKIRNDLVNHWLGSDQKCLAVKKEDVKSHGNGAVLLNEKAIDLLVDPLVRLSEYLRSNLHPIVHPWKVRPVADKWLYGALPKKSCQVATFPHFCLEADDSTLHDEHVTAFHKPSRDITINIWERERLNGLLEAQKKWDMIR